LKDSTAKIEIVLGDGRVSLSNELKTGASHQFDLLVVDAFSGDSIPQHLLTVEALELYWQQLTVDGVLAVHISNTHLNLSPLMRGLAQQAGKEILYFKTKAKTQTNTQDKTKVKNDAEWVLITNNKDLLNNSLVKAYVSRWSDDSNNTVVWTDNYSNLWSVLK
jgi:spermidine synthase